MQIKKALIAAVKIAIIVLSFGFIYFKIKHELAEHKFSDIFKGISDYKLLIIAFLLVFVNWGIETFKWQYLVRYLQKISFLQAFKGVLAGISVSIFTPNRIGDFGGRIWVLNKKNRTSGIFATLLGSYAQLLTTILFGLFLLPFYIYYNPNVYIPKGVDYHLLIFVSGFIAILGLILFFNPNYIITVFKNSKWIKYVEFAKQYSKVYMLKILIISILRYFVFFFQFYLLLRFFNVEITIFQSLCGVSLIYLLSNLVPVFSMFEFGVRGTLSIVVLGAYSPLSISLLYASLLLWFINLAVPALFGLVVISRLKVNEG